MPDFEHLPLLLAELPVPRESNATTKSPNAALLALYARRAVPRYTSYPTAPHFAKHFSPLLYRQWLGSLDTKEAVSLYVHIPFCKQMCWYCGCNMKLAARYGPVREYVDHLLAEIDLVAAALPGSLPVSHLHFGGGTPTALSPEDLTRLVRHIEAKFIFRADAERAIETDPRTITDEMIATIGGLGFTRASLGVQEFDPRVQAAINRVQPAALVTGTTQKLRKAGVRSINFDLIYGLPQQTLAALCSTVRECIAMRPDRIVLFGYAHVPWMAKNQRMIDDQTLPDPNERAAQARSSAQELIAGGYRAIGIDHFALPEDPLSRAAEEGRLHRNFQGYTDDAARTLIAFGATAIGRTPSGYVQNEAETGAWAHAIAAGKLPIAKGHAMKGEDCLRAYVIEKIMCEGTIDLDAAARQFGFPENWHENEDAMLQKLDEEGLILRQGALLSLTREGTSLARIVAATFDSYLADSQARHSVAV
jgi:oxygen-independent coproporphyrinogen-3 oxidase